jgi:hypothetical protein
MKCDGKIPHATRDEALDHVKRLVYKHHLAGEDHRSAGLTPYPCDICGAWHVGHREQTPPVWHYTTMRALDDILQADELRPAPPLTIPKRLIRRAKSESVAALRTMQEREPLLWFSRNPQWEYSVDKINVGTSGRARMELFGRGLLRFGVPAAFAKLRWADYLARNPMPKFIRDDMARRGNPAEWLATDEAVPLQHVRTIEVYMRGWKPVADVADDVFADYLAGREVEYDEAHASLTVKLVAAYDQLVTVGADIAMNEAEYILWMDYQVRRATRDAGNPAAMREMIKHWRSNSPKRRR